ncbi:MAG: mandelate racemase/muconate lactonizing enzyme family protein [Chloroflexi bacterium]|nr:mandelate racemase/muconate lactonizing enzyme family protein [Chloroflexota bacterium]
MKITDVRTTVLAVPNRPPKDTYYPTNHYVITRILTDEGLEGLGYTMLVGGSGSRSVRTYLEESIIPAVIGEDPAFIGCIWDQLYRNDRGIRKPGIPLYGISAIDIGLWDLLGKATGKPLYQLLGATRPNIPVYGGGGYISYSVKQLVEEAEGTLALGAKYYKMKIGVPNLRENVDRVAAVRKAIGDDIGLLVDANQRWDAQTSIMVGHWLEPYGLFWFEEPALADDVEAIAQVAHNIAIPVATGENEYTRFGFRNLIERRAARYLNPDPQRTGGISELLMIAHLAAAYDVKIAPHLTPELSVHVLCAIPNGVLIEWSMGAEPEIWEEPPTVVDGLISPPDRPGHGMTFRREALRRYALD